MTIFPLDPDLTALRLALARLRGKRGWTFDELAERSGLARRTLIDLERGRTTGSVTTWHALAHAFGVSIDQLLGNLREGHTPPTPPEASAQ
ncbi:helix-turn-helix transcriptional regulator [Streptomyces sp. NPDC019937]|uniref:helix-turn-helix domain-containing protein n=1 Tax=Streptomyces sp. NPDC019937 TaxID=3154787 RepID=UPI0033D22ABA